MSHISYPSLFQVGLKLYLVKFLVMLYHLIIFYWISIFDRYIIIILYS
jgi:hypothetical protein